MEFIKSKDPTEGAQKLAVDLVEQLQAGKRVLWLIAGGSNIPIAKHVMDLVRANLGADGVAKLFPNLSISLTDERFGPIGHPDSNWKQLIDSGFDFSGISAEPILIGASLEDTIEDYGEHIGKLFDEAEIVIAQLGIGHDGHIVGILPQTSAVEAVGNSAGYVAKPFTRVTMTFELMRRISIAYLFAYGPAKVQPILDLKSKNLPLAEEPAQILKSIPTVYICSDVN